ncbi:CvpA family protein [Inhella gelatinilytica]|uniref:CvpA family protein n=1 Tax=Inhella gelatinilytica TaxID=2795030 RepID=A0A931IXZ8_9BURK|nr:CvpA family protein [Inhella gelatinilytica]MBH9553080.1 CvpA family protein [Inhella gelatinilytica]
MSEASISLTAMDWAALGVVVVSIGVGLWRGLVLELMSLAGWVIAYFGAPWLAPALLPWIRMPQAEWKGMAAVVLAFVIILVLWALVARLIRLLIHLTPLIWIDRALGGLFGVLRGVLLLLLLAVIIGFTPLRQHAIWTNSVSRPVLHTLLDWAAPMLPEGFKALLNPQ